MKIKRKRIFHLANCFPNVAPGSDQILSCGRLNNRYFGSRDLLYNSLSGFSWPSKSADCWVVRLLPSASLLQSPFACHAHRHIRRITSCRREWHNGTERGAAEACGMW